MQIDRYLGKGGKKLRQQRSYLHRAEGHGRRQTHQAAWRTRLRLRGVLGCLTLGKDVGSATHQLSSGIRQLEAAGRADDQPRAKPQLDPADRLRHGRLREPQLGCGVGEGATFRNLRKDGEPFKVRQFSHDDRFRNRGFR